MAHPISACVMPPRSRRAVTIAMYRSMPPSIANALVNVNANAMHESGDNAKMAVKTTIGERLRAAREARGWSQLRLAKEAGVSQGTIAGIETGQRGKRPNLLPIAHALGIDAYELQTGRVVIDQAPSAAMDVDQAAAVNLLEQLRAVDPQGAEEIESEIYRRIGMAAVSRNGTTSIKPKESRPFHLSHKSG